MALLSGEYTVKATRRVIVWPEPDANGNGALKFDTKLDGQGRNVGQIKVKDKWGNEVRSYKAPDGFANIPSYDHSSNWVMVDHTGEVVRQPNGESITIAEGQAIVLGPDNSVLERLEDEYAQYIWEDLHDKLGSTTVEAVETVEPVALSDDERAAEIAKLEALLKGLKGEE